MKKKTLPSHPRLKKELTDEQRVYLFQLTVIYDEAAIRRIFRALMKNADPGVLADASIIRDCLIGQTRVARTLDITDPIIYHLIGGHKPDPVQEWFTKNQN